MFKKYVAVLLSGLMLVSAVSLTGCGSNSDSDSKKSDTKTEDSSGGDNLAESKDLLAKAIDELKTTDNHPLMEEGTTFDVPEAEGTAEELEKLDDTDMAKWHYYEYLDWDDSNDSKFPESPADGQKGKHVIVIVHGAHAWTTCYQEAFEEACEAVGMTCDVYDPNWDQSTQDGYVDQAINESPDAIVVIPVSADHA